MLNILKFNILKSSDLYHYETAKFMCLVLKNNSLPKFKYFFNYVNSVYSRSTRSAVSKKLSAPYFRLTKFQKSIAYQGVKIWNIVPNLYKKKCRIDNLKPNINNFCFNLMENNRRRNLQMS